MNETKVCTVCKTEYPATSEYFHKGKKYKDGLGYSCKSCCRKYNMEYRIKNKDLLSKKHKEYRIKNLEGISQQNKQYYAKHRERHMQYAKEYGVKNKDYISQHQKDYRIEHKDHIVQYKKEYYIKYKECIAQKRKEYRANNKELIAQQKKEEYIKHKEHISQRAKEYYAKHKDQLAKCNKEYYVKNKEHLLQYEKEYKKTENGHLVCLCSEQKRRTAKKGTFASLTVLQWKQIKLYFSNKCAYCGEKKPLTQEHFIALNKGGEYTQNNIIPACASCNSSKHDTSFFVWYPSQIFYSKAREKKILKFLNYHEQNQQLRLFISI